MAGVHTASPQICARRDGGKAVGQAVVGSWQAGGGGRGQAPLARGAGTALLGEGVLLLAAGGAATAAAAQRALRRAAHAAAGRAGSARRNAPCPEESAPAGGWWAGVGRGELIAASAAAGLAANARRISPPPSPACCPPSRSRWGWRPPPPLPAACLEKRARLVQQRHPGPSLGHVVGADRARGACGSGGEAWGWAVRRWTESMGSRNALRPPPWCLWGCVPRGGGGGASEAHAWRGLITQSRACADDGDIVCPRWQGVGLETALLGLGAAQGSSQQHRAPDRRGGGASGGQLRLAVPHVQLRHPHDWMVACRGGGGCAVSRRGAAQAPTS